MSAVRSDLAVVLCTYNGVRHVGAQLRSILEQRVLPGEIRVYDDGSRDGTIGEVERVFAARPERAADVGLHVAAEEDRSFGAAGNFARAMADTPQPLVALCDQDDEWLPDRLADAVAVLDARPDVEVVASNALMVDGDGHPVGRTVFEAQRLTRGEHAALRQDDCLPPLLRRNLIPGMTFTVRRALVDRLGPLPTGAMHDYWLAAAAAARGTLHISPRALVRYRIHGANTVGLDTGRRSPADRVRIKLRAFRAPLTDLPQWAALPERLRGIGDAVAADRLEGKRRFEQRRRYADRSPERLLKEAAVLLSGDGYRMYDFQGRITGLRDLVRRRDPYLAAAQ